MISLTQPELESDDHASHCCAQDNSIVHHMVQLQSYMMFVRYVKAVLPSHGLHSNSSGCMPVQLPLHIRIQPFICYQTVVKFIPFAELENRSSTLMLAPKWQVQCREDTWQCALP